MSADDGITKSNTASEVEDATPLRALVAHADSTLRSDIVNALTELGHDVDVATDGGEAWRAFEEWRPDLVVLDVDMPIVDGIEVCRRIREQDEEQRVFVLFLVRRDRPHEFEHLLECGGDEFIVTPTTSEDLHARFLVVRRRITQDAARRGADEELARARWLSGIGEATLSLQHEINNPLSALLGNAELMRMDYKERGEKSELLDVIHEQALRIADVVRRLRQLKDPESVDYVGGSKMINFWKGQAT